MPQDETQEQDVLTEKFSPEEQKKIVKLVVSDIEADESAQQDWIEARKVSLSHYNAERPSILENLDKKKPQGMNIRAWQSDRNMGVCPAICDTYISTFMATCWNPDSIHAIATEANDIDNKDNVERFAKWMVGKNEVNAIPEVSDYIHNKVTQGFSIFEIFRNVWYEWVDRRIQKPDGSFEVKTEKVRFEKAVLENINNLDDILMPRYGNNIQKLPHIIRIIHLTGTNILTYGEDGIFTNVDAKMVMKFQQAADLSKDGLERMKADDLGLSDVVDEDFRALPIDVYKWYGYYTKDGRRERYRFLIERKTDTFLSGKPLRKITKTGKFPFVGGPLDRVPGQVRGRDIPTIIKDPVNALNLAFNQKADFQYVTNCPFGFHKAGEGYTKNVYDLEPGVSYPTEGNPNESIFFPNLQRSMAWAEQDIRICFEVIEKRTGAASFFQTNERNATGTATRDTIVQRNSETRFGKWVASIQDELAEALTMLLNIYQEHTPENLGERILGEDGKKLFPNLSVETIRYNSDVQMVPDVIAGSKAYEKQVYLWAYQALQTSIWLNPQMNPKGNWLLTADTMRKQGFAAPERYLPPEPKAELGAGQDVKDVWARLMQGEVVEPEESWNVPEVLAGLLKKKDQDYFSLDPEYRPNLDSLIFKTEVAMRLFIKKMQEEQMVNQLAQRAIAAGGGNPGGMPMGMAPNEPQMPQGQPLPQEAGMMPPQGA